MQVTKPSAYQINHPKLDPIANWFPAYRTRFKIEGTCVFTNRYYLEL